MFGIIPFFAWNKTSGVTCVGDLISTTDLQVYYKMDGDVLDSSGNGYDGTATAITYTDGKFASASVFNGTTSKIVNSTYTMPGVAQGMSYGGWVKVSTYGANTNHDVLWSKWDPGVGGFEVRLYNRLGVPEWNFGIVRAGVTIAAINTTSTTPAVGVWTHVFVVLTATSMTLFVDGSQVAQDTFSSDYPHAATGDLIIGGFDLPPTGRFFDGDIDDFSLWHRALTTDEITTLAAGTCPLNT